MHVKYWRWIVIFKIVKNLRNSCFHWYLGIWYEKCIQMSTNIPSIGQTVLEITLSTWRTKSFDIQTNFVCTYMLQPASKELQHALYRMETVNKYLLAIGPSRHPFSFFVILISLYYFCSIDKSIQHCRKAQGCSRIKNGLNLIQISTPSFQTFHPYHNIQRLIAPSIFHLNLKISPTISLINDMNNLLGYKVRHCDRLFKSKWVKLKTLSAQCELPST